MSKSEAFWDRWEIWNKPISPDDYDLHRLKLGVPDGNRDVLIDRGILLECGFDELNAIDWNKGCYMGQELTARTRYRGLGSQTPYPSSDSRRGTALPKSDSSRW